MMQKQAIPNQTARLTGGMKTAFRTVKNRSLSKVKPLRYRFPFRAAAEPSGASSGST